MPSTSNNPYLVKSMNGAITIDDGMGTTITDGTITTQTLGLTDLTVNKIKTNVIDALNTAYTNTCTLFHNVTQCYIYIGFYNNTKIFIGNTLTQTIIGALRITNNDIDTDGVNDLNIGITNATNTNLGGVINSIINLKSISKFFLGIYTDSIQPYTNGGNLTLTAPITNITSTNSISLLAPTTTLTSTTTISLTSPNTRVSERGFNKVFIVTDGTGSTNTYMDFYSSGFNVYSSRIISNGGTSTGLSGTLDILSGTINITAPITTITSSTALNLTNTATNICLNGLNGFRMRQDGTGISNSYMDFYSAGVNFPSSRILSTGGDSTNFNGTLGIYSGVINISPTTSTTINKQVSLGWLQTNITPCYTNINGVNGQCNIDFHSSGTNNVTYDSRIYAYGGDATAGNGAMAFTGTQFAFLGDVLTSAIKARTPGGTLTIGDNLLGGSLTIGSSLTTGTMNITTGGLLNIVASSTVTITAPQMIMTGTQNLGYVGGTVPSYLEITTGGGNSFIDFHSGSSNVDFDTRILSYGGGATSQLGSLNYYAGSHNFNGGVYFINGVRFNSGFSFAQGNLTSASFIQTGSGNPNISIGSGSAMTPISIGFTSAFSASPIVTVTLYTNNAASMGVILSCVSPSTTGFTLNAYNSRSVTAVAGTWDICLQLLGQFNIIII